MKKLLLLTLILCSCGPMVPAQGTYDFVNSLNSTVGLYSAWTGQFLGYAPVGTKVELFYQPGSNPAPAPIFESGGITSGNWEAMSAGPFTMVSTNGRFAAGIETTGTDVAPGGDAWLTAVAWTGGWSTLQQAVESGNSDFAESTIFELQSGGGGTPPSTPVSITSSELLAGSQFSGVYIIVDTPEPCGFAIGSLGLLVGLSFHWRRNAVARASA